MEKLHTRLRVDLRNGRSTLLQRSSVIGRKDFGEQKARVKRTAEMWGDLRSPTTRMSRILQSALEAVEHDVIIGKNGI
jgi:metal-dependent amidase/aminoacylase/carboxypeptidase family protein